MSNSYEIALRWILRNTFDDESAMDQEKAWCQRAITQKAFIWANVDQHLCCDIASLGHRFENNSVIEIDVMDEWDFTRSELDRFKLSSEGTPYIETAPGHSLSEPKINKFTAPYMCVCMEKNQFMSCSQLCLCCVILDIDSILVGYIKTSIKIYILFFSIDSIMVGTFCLQCRLICPDISIDPAGKICMWVDSRNPIYMIRIDSLGQIHGSPAMSLCQWTRDGNLGWYHQPDSLIVHMDSCVPLWLWAQWATEHLWQLPEEYIWEIF